MLTSSGQAANFYAVFNICEAGDHLVCSSTIYGGTFNLFSVTLKKLGIDCTFIDADAPDEEIEKAFRPNTKCLFGEIISNPSINVLDIEKFARIAHKHGVPLIVDNTFATPINCRPFEWGADIVTHSTTKYMDGHATCVGGAIVDSGNFDWMAHADKFPGLTTPDESYHGLTYAKAFGKMAYITKATAQLMRDLGSIQSPENAFLLNLGLETLHLRMQRHCENAQQVAEWLEAQPKVKWVNYCGLKSSKYYELAQKYNALVMVDESHSAGVVGKTGHGVTEQYDLRGKIEIITGTLGKAFGGSVGGFTTGKKEIIDLLRQRSRPYLFSNSIPPMIAAAGIKTFEILTRSNELQDRLHANTDYFVARMKEAGFDIKPTQSAICAVMLYDARLSQEFAAALQEEGIYVTGFYYPVVPQGQARIRVQLSAAHTREQLDKGVAAFVKVGKALGVLKG